MLLLTYDPNVKNPPEEPKRDYSISLISPYGTPAKYEEIRRQFVLALLTAFSTLAPRLEENDG